MLFNIVAFNGAALMNKLASQSSRAAIIGRPLLPLKGPSPSPPKTSPAVNATKPFFDVTNAVEK